MNRMLDNLLQKLSFRRQLSITVTLGILFLALCSSVVGSWQGNKRVRNDLVEQGRRITENLANQSSLALIYGSADNVSEAVKTTLVFPGVIGVEIRDVKGRVLVARGNTSLSEFIRPVDDEGGLHAAALLSAETPSAWYFSALVYSQPDMASPYSEAPSPELLGHVAVVMSKAELDKMTTSIFTTNLATSLSFALIFLFLIQRLTTSMTKPLNRLSEGMNRAQKGAEKVRVEPSGPSDISGMAHVFNNMMSVLEHREADLRIAAIAFETEEGMMVTDENAVILRVNQAFTHITGYSTEEAIGKNPSMLKSGRHDDAFFKRLWERLESFKSWQGEVLNRRKNGEIFPVWLTITAVQDKDGSVTNYVGTFTDFTERKRAEEEIHHLAFYDPLCSLPNRRLMLDRLRQAAAVGARNQTGGALLFIDLDNFKNLNDTKGHGVGDLLLIEVAKRLQTCLRKGDTLARFGGDEFVLLLVGLSSDPPVAAIQARGVGEKVLEVLRRPYMLEGNEFHSSSSVGVTLFFNYRQNLDELLKQADTAMYEAKKAGRNTLRFFDPAMQYELEARSLLEAGLRDALNKREFRLYYQMQVNHVGKVVGAEALLRWVHPERGMIAPLEFIPLAEETGLILPIGQWVMESACEQLKQWESASDTHELQLAVNVSGRQFRHPDFVSQVITTLERSGINPHRLKLELTESIVLDDVPDTIAKMKALSESGVSFSLDDFGTGYSSLSYLSQLPFYQLKIDQSFVRDVVGNENNATIIQTIIGMAKNLGMEVIAEGVETTVQHDFLRKAGCLFYQGYLFSKPVPLAEFEQKAKLVYFKEPESI